MKTVKIFSIIFSTLFTVYLNASKSKIESIPFIPSGPTLISHNKYAKESQMARAKLLTPIYEDTLRAKELEEAFNGKRPLYSIIVTRKERSVLQSAERYFLGETIRCFLNGSEYFLDAKKLEKCIMTDIEYFLDINSKISSNVEEIKNKNAQIAAEKIYEIDQSLQIENIKQQLIYNTYQSKNPEISDIIDTYKEQISEGNIRADKIKQLSLYERSFYEKMQASIKQTGQDVAPEHIHEWQQDSQNAYIDSLKDEYIKIWNKIQLIRKKYETKLTKVKNSYGFIVFNEMFFGKNIPFDKNNSNKIENFAKWLSKFCKNKILFTNMIRSHSNKQIFTKNELNSLKIRFRDVLDLEDKCEEDRNSDQLNYENAISDFLALENSLFSSTIDDYKPFSKYVELLEKYTDKPILRFENISQAFLNSKELYQYKKNSYFSECDDLIKMPAFYNFGDKNNIDIAKTKESKILCDNITTSICRDFQIGIHSKLDNDKKLYLLQSNTITIDSSNNCNIPINSSIVIHSDPNLIDNNGNIKWGTTDVYSREYVENLETHKNAFITQNSGISVLNVYIPVLGEKYSIHIREISGILRKD